MNYSNLFLGILILFGTFFYLIYEINKFKKVKKEDHIMRYFYIKIFSGITMGIVIGIAIIYRELKHLL